MENEIVEGHVYQPRPQEIQTVTELSVDQVVTMTNKVKEIAVRLMVENEDYGVIPGCKKKSLWQPGAEKLCLAFRLKPSYVVTPTDMGDGHREYISVCTLTHIPSGRVFGEGVASCSTMESKYRYRGEGRKCPQCGAEAIIKGKDEFGGGWLCFKKKGGCGAKFKDGDSQIEQQEGGKVENPDIADTYNTVIQIACKRAYVKATRSATAASGIFTDTIGDPDDPQVNATLFPDRQSQKPPVQPPQRQSARPAAAKPTTTNGPPPDATSIDANALTVMCQDIADAGYTVTTQDHKTFSLTMGEGVTADSICIALSSFVGRDKKIVAGKRAADLSAQALKITAGKAKKLWDGLQQYLSSEPPLASEGEGTQTGGDNPGYYCAQCDQGFDTPKVRKINGHDTSCCPMCGTSDIMPWTDYMALAAQHA